jgi:hypothetical protein
MGIWSLSNIQNTQTHIRILKPKVKLNLSQLPNTNLDWSRVKAPYQNIDVERFLSSFANITHYHSRNKARLT